MHALGSLLLSKDAWARLVAAACRWCTNRGSSRRRWRTSPQAAGVPLGNVYYYFKTKNDLVAAVIATTGRRTI